MRIITNYNDILAKEAGIFYFPSKVLARAFVNEYFSSNKTKRRVYHHAIDSCNNIAIRLENSSIVGYDDINHYLSPGEEETYQNYEKYEVNYTNKTSNFSEGDFVRIREDLRRDTYYGRVYVNSDMEQIRGFAGIIDSVYSECEYSLKGGEWCWNDAMFENVIVINGVGIPVNENLVLY